MKKNLPLIVGIALPLLFVGILVAVVSMPPLFVNPQHDFLYTMSGSPYSYAVAYKNSYTLVDGEVTLQPVVIPPNYNTATLQNAPILYRYEVKDGSAHTISLSDAQSLKLDPGPTSPDGYTVSYNYGNNGIFGLFGGNTSDNGYYISNGHSSKKLTSLTTSDYYSGANFQLIGWVE